MCHIFYILRFLVGSEVETVYCATGRPDDETIVVTFSNGCIASIMSSGYVCYDMPKESLEVITRLGGLTVQDFVELRTFGLSGCESRYLFDGHFHPDRDRTHVKEFAKSGIDALLRYRRIFYEKDLKLDALRANGTQSPERDELEAYMQTAPLINYMMDKGWLQALEHFAQSILDDTTLSLPGLWMD